MRNAHPRAFPIVELDSAPMKTKIGSKLRPYLRIVDWTGLDQQAQPALIEAKRVDDFDDEIPF
jgi:hypothetical protein